VNESQRHQLLEGCKAFLFPGEEDFGITPLEAMAAGRPVIAYAAAGALDTVVDGITGRFFYEQTPAALATAIAASRTDCFEPERIRIHAEGFRTEIFLDRMRTAIAEILANRPAI
jgi:glycosyltransferase involved in cell wall biosynthesis